MAKRLMSKKAVNVQKTASAEFKHYIAKPTGQRLNRDLRVPYRYFDDVCEAARIAVKYNRQAFEIIAIYADGKMRLARVMEGALPQ